MCVKSLRGKSAACFFSPETSVQCGNLDHCACTTSELTLGKPSSSPELFVVFQTFFLKTI